MADDDDPTLAELGEFTVIDRLIALGRQPDSVLIGPGDDAALLTAIDGRVLVSTDMLVEGRHFRLDWSSPHDVGRKAIAQNAADIEAMGGSPEATGHGHGVARVGAPAGYGPAAIQFAEHGHRHHPLRAAHQVTADNRGPARTLGLGPHPLRQRGDPARLGVGRCSERHHETRGPSAHGLDVGGILRDRLTSDVVR